MRIRVMNRKQKMEWEIEGEVVLGEREERERR